MSESNILDKGQQELIDVYGRSDKGNFGVIDTLPEKHLYCIGIKLMAFGSEHYNGILSEECIRAAEKQKGIYCETCETAYRRRDIDKVLDYDEHKHGLLVECLVKAEEKTKEAIELTKYLKKCIKMEHFKKNGYVGFVLLDKFSKK